jgi:DNA-binding CsgD family transcriptional regulator/transcriptional regulator with GAF, ATPase, and Fis domain
MEPIEAEARSAAGSSASFTERRRVLRECLAALGAVDTTAGLNERAPAAIAEACGFSRAMISAVRGSRWVPLRLHTRDDLDANAAGFRSYVDDGAEIPLANLLAETMMVRRRTGVLVPTELIQSRAFAPIIEVAQSPAYVAAPIVVEGRAIGFLHADRVGQERVVDEDDRRLIEAFAGEFAVLHQRVWWSERVSERRQRVEAELERAVDALRRVESSGPGLSAAADSPPAAWSAPRSADPGRSAARFLTGREWDVLALVAEGATNRVIAHRLTLSEDTVKTHLRGVLRKLGVTSRASAVAWYLDIGRGVR